MNKQDLLNNINKVEQMASASKLKRMFAQPFSYANAILYRELIYKRSKKEKEVKAKTFFGFEMSLLLPSSTDIYLTSGKSHESEIRLAKFLIKHLHAGEVFVDVGAHYGYFSLLASKLIGDLGSVYAFEASPTTFALLRKNAKGKSNINVFNQAVSDEKSVLTFYEFPNLYSEYNSLDVDQFAQESWFKKSKPRKVEVDGIPLGQYLSENGLVPKIIKIDVEGAEYKVIKGLKDFLVSASGVIVMEFLSEIRGNRAHLKAKELLESLNYEARVINNDGELSSVKSIQEHLDQKVLDSDNVVFVKREKL